ncbi:Uncharacterised protein [Klebsiella pneumoniae]|uniref:Uncharacterized protein n=1 Tax=Klebsiella pneumoniae TaxID=573 RepID=A0A377WSZ4_KLEPN|nr:Uncharacterised protein [Klebsiella pneumoniae]
MIALDCNMRQPNQGFAPGRVREDLQRGNGFVSFFLRHASASIPSEPQVAIVSSTASSRWRPLPCSIAPRIIAD